jgi:hypothetical protein
MDMCPLPVWIELDIADLLRQDLAMSPKIPQIPPKAPRRIEVLAFPDVQMQVFTPANERAASPRGRFPYETWVVATEGAQIRSRSGLAFATEPLPDPR